MLHFDIIKILITLWNIVCHVLYSAFLIYTFKSQDSTWKRLSCPYFTNFEAAFYEFFSNCYMANWLKNKCNAPNLCNPKPILDTTNHIDSVFLLHFQLLTVTIIWNWCQVMKGKCTLLQVLNHLEMFTTMLQLEAIIKLLLI